MNDNAKTGLAAYGRGSSVRESVRALADNLESLTGDNPAGFPLLLESLGKVAIDLDSAMAKRDEHAAALSYCKGDLATLRLIADSVCGAKPLELKAAEGERVDPGFGAPIRSNANWHRLATAALAERDQWQRESESLRLELREAQSRAAENWQARNLAQARCNNAESSLNQLLIDSIAIAAADDESRAMIAELLAAKASLARVDAAAARMMAESPSDRLARLQAGKAI